MKGAILLSVKRANLGSFHQLQQIMRIEFECSLCMVARRASTGSLMFLLPFRQYAVTLRALEGAGKRLELKGCRQQDGVLPTGCPRSKEPGRKKDDRCYGRGLFSKLLTGILLLMDLFWRSADGRPFRYVQTVVSRLRDCPYEIFSNVSIFENQSFDHRLWYCFFKFAGTPSMKMRFRWI